MTEKHTLCEISTETRILHNLLEKVLLKEERPLVTYTELNAAIGRNVQQEAAGLLQTARKNVEKEHGVIIDVVRSEGLKLTNDYAGVLDQQSRQIYRKAGKHSRRVLRAMMNQEDLPREQRLRITERLSTMNAVRLFSKRTVPPQLTAYIKKHDVSQELPVAQTLKLFSSNGQVADE